MALPRPTFLGSSGMFVVGQETTDIHFTNWPENPDVVSELFCQGANDLSYIVVRLYPIIMPANAN